VHASPAANIGTAHSIQFLKAAETIAPLPFQTIQSDHGSEFSRGFTTRVLARDMIHRHSRIRTPNDKAHLERFNRTIQEECLERLPRNLRIWRKEVPEYLRWYNEKRPHLGFRYAVAYGCGQKLLKLIRWVSSRGRCPGLLFDID
jgi:transposase InsO family protein